MKIKKIAALILVTLITAACFTSCQTKKEETSGKIKISVTVAPEKEFLENVCGQYAEVNVIVPAGADPESFDPSIDDVKAFSDSDIYFTIGMPQEENSILPMVGKDTLVVHLEEAVSEKIPDLYIGSERDPHIWLSADRAIIMTEKIRDTLISFDKEHSDIYVENAENYIKRLKDAKSYAEDVLSSLSDREFIVFHPAFGYFADEHNLTMHALEDEGKEASAKELAALIDYARENGIKTIFYQEESGGAQAKTFAKEINGEAVMLSPLSENYIENYCLTADKIKESKS